MPASTAPVKTAAEPRVLPSIPLDVLHHIATLIERSSAHALARTCKSLRDAGEIKIWQRVELKHDATEADVDELSPSLRDIVLQRNKQAIEQKTKAERVWQALQSYPPRTSYVKSLLITPFLEKHTEQLRLLEMVHPYLTTLTIRGVRGSTVPLLGESPSKHNFYTKFSGKKLKLERLRDLRVHIGDDDDFKQIFGLMKGMPTLKTLELEAYEKEHEWPTLDRTDITAIPKLPGLVHLSINVMFVGMANALIGLLAKAPNLKHLAIDGKWSPLPRSPGLKAIKKHKGIEAVSWFAPSRIPARDLFDGDTQPNLTTLVETRTDEGEADECLLHVSVFQISVGFAQLTVSVPQMVLKIPVAAMMTRYVLLHTHRPSVGDYALTGVRTLTEEDAAKRAEVLHPMKAWFARSLKYAPDLTEIHFGHKYDGACFPGTKRSSIPDQVKDAYEPWGWLKPTIPTEHWERLGWRGAIIRTYSRPDNGAREFVHIRLLSRSVYLDSTATYVGAQRQRSDFGFYRYQPLTDSVLATIYDLAGMPSAFLEGGRNLTLPAQAWEALDDYACKRNRKLGISMTWILRTTRSRNRRIRRTLTGSTGPPKQSTPTTTMTIPEATSAAACTISTRTYKT